MNVSRRNPILEIDEPIPSFLTRTSGQNNSLQHVGELPLPKKAEPPPRREETPIQRLILNEAVVLATSKVNDTRMLHTAYGELLDFMARYRHERIMPDEYAALTQVALSFAKVLTLPYFEKQASTEGAVAFAVAGARAVDGFQAKLEATIANKLAEDNG